MYNTTYTVLQNEVDDTTTRKSDQGKAWPPNAPGAQVAEDDIQQTPAPGNNVQGLGEQMHSSNEATLVSTKTRFTNLKIQIL